MTSPRSKLARRKKGFSKNRNRSDIWIYGIHAVREALLNETRKKHQLILTENARMKLGTAIEHIDVPATIVEPQKFSSVLPAGSVHQGVALKADPLAWPPLKLLCRNTCADMRFLLLDRVTDPHNVGAILRSARAFEVNAVIAPSRHAPPETGTLAKSASGALEHVPYLRVSNLATAMSYLQKEAFTLIGFDSDASVEIGQVPKEVFEGHIGLVLGSESAGLRSLTHQRCDWVVRVCAGSLNVSNAAAVAMHAAKRVRV